MSSIKRRRGKRAFSICRSISRKT